MSVELGNAMKTYANNGSLRSYSAITYSYSLLQLLVLGHQNPFNGHLGLYNDESG